MTSDKVLRWQTLIPLAPDKVNDEAVRRQAIKELCDLGDIRVINWKIEEVGALLQFIPTDNPNDSYYREASLVVVHYLIW